jgi:hypothetical protein
MLHLRGVRVRFVEPIRLYLFSGLLFLSLLTFVLEGPRLQVDLVDFNLIVRPPPVDCPRTTQFICGAIERAASLAGRPRESLPAGFARRLLELTALAAFLGAAAIASVLSRLPDGHGQTRWGLVFTAHLHVFWFLLATVALFIPARLAPGAALVAIGYALCSMQQVHEGRWQRTALQTAAHASAHAALLIGIGLAVALVLLRQR